MADTQPWLSAFHGPAMRRSQERVAKAVREGTKTTTDVKSTSPKGYHGDQPKAVIRSVAKFNGDEYGAQSRFKDGMLSDHDKRANAARLAYSQGKISHVPNEYREGFDLASKAERRSGEIAGKIRNTPVGAKTANARPDSPFKRAKGATVVVVIKK